MPWTKPEVEKEEEEVSISSKGVIANSMVSRFVVKKFQGSRDGAMPHHGERVRGIMTQCHTCVLRMQVTDVQISIFAT